ncbi:hypothetical protein [Bacillus weihaiensis]|uniref:hypothetical protein n=1 Tax=Bacillus weihaiensis TaxID=1547283 RepID=UPI0023558CC9|nr:hypothetical protein [Bacillus weihaiensis]
MKKRWLVLSALMLTLALTACSNEGETEGKEEETTATETTNSEDTEKATKSAMMQFYMTVSKTINEKDGDLNAYEAAVGTEEPPTAEMKASAEAAAAEVVSDLDSVEIPEALADQKADLEAVVQELKDSYQAKADELKKEEPSLDAANETFTSADEKMGQAFESVGLNPSSLSTEVNG